MPILSRHSLLPMMIFLALLAGCNIYEWTTNDDSTTDVVEEGRELMRDGDYEAAFNLFDDALRDDPDNSLLRYLHAKAALKRTGVSTLTLATEITALQTMELHADLPFMSNDVWPDSRADSLYNAIFIVLDDLRHIRYGETYGEIDSTDVMLDMTIGTTVNALLRFRDTNGDSTILSPPDFNLSIFFSLDTLQQNGLDSMSADDINDLLDQLDTLMKEGLDNLLDLLGDSLDEDNGFNEDELEEILDKLREGKDMYRVHDGLDNDGDWVLALHDLDGNGEPSADWDGPFADANGDGVPTYDPEPQVDEEELNGVDDDGDGLTDEDSHYYPPSGG